MAIMMMVEALLIDANFYFVWLHKVSGPGYYYTTLIATIRLCLLLPSVV